MEKHAFHLSTGQLKEIAQSLKSKIETGLKEENTEIQCIPTYINPLTTGVEGKALVLDLGGTNYRAAVVEFKNNQVTIYPESGWKKDLSVMKGEGYTQEQLFKEQADLIGGLKEKELPIGYCFSFPAQSMLNGDAHLLRWTKGVNIQKMVGQPVGAPLMNYLNSRRGTKYTRVRVINDTVASLFAGLRATNYDAYIGLIVGTGTNMAAFVPAEKIEKLDKAYTKGGLIPVNLESGNFHPPYLTDADEKVDAGSDNKGKQRFEKAVSGMYLGEVLKAAFPETEFEGKFDALKLTNILNYPDIYKEEYVKIGRAIYERSAFLVASSLAGLILELVSYSKDIKNVCLTAEGSLFWSEDRNGKNYKDMVLDKLELLLNEFGYNIRVDIIQMDNANLIGSAIAALS